jgi:hypothetical protein
MAWWGRWRDANVAVRTGAASRAVVLDIDTPKGGQATLAALEREYGRLPPTYEVLTGGGGRHLYFAHPGTEVPCSEGKLGPGLDVRGDGGYVVAPPSVHASGRPYKVLHDRELAPLPAWLLEDAEKRRNGETAEPLEQVIPEGIRRRELLSLAGTLRRRGLGEPEILATLRTVNAARCRPPLDEHELAELAEDVADRWQPDPLAAIRSETPAKPRSINQVIATFEKWLWLPDTSPVYATLGATAANHLDGSPVWLLLVGPPSSGKTEILSSLTALPGAHAAAVLSEAALLSGTPRKEQSSGASGGLLREIGDFGFILAKDFGSLLSMRHDTRGPVLAALREIYDGSWDRPVGTEGGRKLSWRGKCALIGGCTQSIDRHYAVISAMGDRFVLFRMPTADAVRQAVTALDFTGEKEQAMRRELGAAVSGLFAVEPCEQSTGLSADDRARLVTLAVLVARCRSSVERDSYTREIELIPSPEMPARLARALERLLAGLRALNVDENTAWHVIRKTALDSMPALRKTLIDQLVAETEAVTTAVLATIIHHPTKTTRRGLEDLAAHGVVVRHSQGQGKADLWEASEWLRENYSG